MSPPQPDKRGRHDRRERSHQQPGLSKRYGDRHAVRELTLSVPSRVVCGLVEPNGAGKTTTIRMLLGLVRPTGGSASVLGTPITHPRDYLPRVGALIEGPAFYPGLSGRRNLQLLASLGGISQRRVHELLEVVGLSDRDRDRVGMYSLGMKQRLGVAAALLPDPELLILDEPANGLDPAGIIEMRAPMRRNARQAQDDLGQQSSSRRGRASGRLAAGAQGGVARCSPGPPAHSWAAAKMISRSSPNGRINSKRWRPSPPSSTSGSWSNRAACVSLPVAHLRPN